MFFPFWLKPNLILLHTVMGKTRRCKSGGQKSHIRIVFTEAERLIQRKTHLKQPLTMTKAASSKDITSKDIPYTASSKEAQEASLTSGDPTPKEILTPELEPQ